MLDPDSIIPQLIASAKDSSLNAYCPYSNFPVGAAILTKDGAIFSGCNVENASFGLAMCAERNAIFQAVSKTDGPVEIEMIVVYTPTSTPTAPCGACRQVINEFGPDAEVISVCEGPETMRMRLPDLLPSSFGPSNLKK